jgi:hypothetical protein
MLGKAIKDLSEKRRRSKEQGEENYVLTVVFSFGTK